MKTTCLISFLFVFNFAFAQSPKQVFFDAKYAIDINSSWKLKDVNKYPFIDFKERLNIGYNKNDAVWCLINITNKENKKVKTWLCFNNNHLDSITFFDGKTTKLLGDRTTNSSPFISTQAFEIELLPNEKKLIITRVKKGISYLDFSISISNSNNLNKQSSQKIALLSFFLGFISLLVLFNGLLFLINKKKENLLFVIYSLLSCIYILISTNYAKHLLLPDYLYFSELRIYIGVLSFISLTWFLSYFLNFKQYHPFSNKIIITLNFINLLLILFSLLFLKLGFLSILKLFFIINYSALSLIIVIICFAAIRHLKINKTDAFYVLFSFLPNLIWVFTLILNAFQLIPKKIEADWLPIFSIFEILLFGYILSKNYLATFLENKLLLKEIVVEKEKAIRSITKTQIKERRAIANIIHDNLGSKIAHVLHLLDMGNSKQAAKTIHQLSADIREISHKILPKSLDEGALLSNLKSQITTLNLGLKKTKIEIYTYDFPEKINEEWVFDLYLITLEIINNALKHSNASEIIIELYKHSDTYHFQYYDNGIGFTISKQTKGFGIENIEKRILFYNGKFEINSTKFEGTTLQITLPISV
jgi:signal transduction histidine kinase